MPLHRRGPMGPAVIRIQALLKELGHYRGPVDGDFGGGTECAVRQFQQGRGLTVGGIAGPATRVALGL